MHCPNCGHKANQTQNYCRSCGFSLEKFSDLYKEQSSVTRQDSSTALSRPQRLMEYLFAAGGTAFIGGGVLLVILLLYNIITKMILEKGQILLGTTLLLFFLGAVLLLVGIYYKESKKDKSQRKSRTSSPEINANITTGNLLPASPSEGISSITERTTELLELRNAQIKRDNRSGELIA